MNDLDNFSLKISSAMEKTAKEFGFSNFNEFKQLVSEVDLSTADKQQSFNSWQENDGTKKGLLKLL